jgi:hypothetical protein
MSVPKICPAGYICFKGTGYDEQSAITNDEFEFKYEDNKLYEMYKCSLGHYCPKGTKTMDIGTEEGQ